MGLFPIESLFILALIGLIAWLVSRSSETPTTTVAPSGGVMNDIVNVVNGKKAERAWVMPVVYVALGALGLLIFYAFLRFALPHLFRERIADVDSVDEWVETKADRLRKHVQVFINDAMVSEANEDLKEEHGTVQYDLTDRGSGYLVSKR